MDSPPADPPTVRFRAGKKRKAYRQRPEDDHDNTESTAGEANPTDTETPNDANEPASTSLETAKDGDDGDVAAVTAALRVRNARKARLGGVGFRSDARPNEQAESSMALTLSEPSGDTTVPVASIPDRFTHQTGFIGALNDKYMNEYIEARMSKHNGPEGSASPLDGNTKAQASAAADAVPLDQSVLRGKLLEVDIAAPPKARGSEEVKTTEPARKKPRLGKDGKPWRPRNRRGSDDIKRDQLVEAFLHENRLDVYDMPDPSRFNQSAVEEDGAADDRLAEQFQKQYLEDMAQRRQRKKPAQPTRQTNEEVLKGPKLGGSRNARAAMRDLLLKKEKETKK